MKKISDFNLERKRVLVRCDFNVPLSEEGEILDDFRIKKTIPTIKYLIRKRAKIILMSHLGRPKNREEKYSLKNVQKRLEKLLRKKVKFLRDCIGKEVENEVKKMREKDVILLENLRFHREEKENDIKFAKALAKLGEIYINDAFATCHRAHASIVSVPKFLPAGMGLLLEKEIENLRKITKNPTLPLIAIFGGREGNYKAINKISEKAEFILIGHLINREIEEKKIILKHPRKIIFPIDGIGGKEKNFDIGPKTIALFKEKILRSKTIFWSGPLGQIEERKFQKGTREVAKTIVRSNAFSVAGGGETIQFLHKIRLAKKFDHLSTGGNSMFIFLSGEKLAGIEALQLSWK